MDPARESLPPAAGDKVYLIDSATWEKLRRLVDFPQVAMDATQFSYSSDANGVRTYRYKQTGGANMDHYLVKLRFQDDLWAIYSADCLVYRDGRFIGVFPAQTPTTTSMEMDPETENYPAIEGCESTTLILRTSATVTNEQGVSLIICQSICGMPDPPFPAAPP